MAVSNVNDFVSQINLAALDLTNEQFRLFHKVVVIDAFKGIIKKTPVDLGHAVHNWMLEINTETNTEREGTDKEKSQTIQAGLQNLESLKPFQVVYISNNVEYIKYLEEGHSKKHPEGMVTVTLHEMIMKYGQ